MNLFLLANAETRLKILNDVTLRISFLILLIIGKEVLHVLGKLPSNFDQEKVMRTFRTNLGVDGSAPKDSGVQVILSNP